MKDRKSRERKKETNIQKKQRNREIDKEKAEETYQKRKQES